MEKKYRKLIIEELYMRIVYVGDNRNRGNFGCRGTSTALSQLLTINNEIVGRISGKFTNWDTGEVYFIPGKKQPFYSKKAMHKYWEYERKLWHYLFRFEGRGGKFLLGKHDFLSLDFDKSIDNLINCLPANPNLQEFDLRQYDFDALVVNGEGSFIFSTPESIWRESIIEAMEMYWALKLGKKVYWLNGMFSDDPNSAHNQKTINSMQEIFERCEAVCVREYQSLNYAHKYFPNTKVTLYPDALFTWYDLINDGHYISNGKYYIPHTDECDEAYYAYDFTKPYACISGSSAIIKACNGDIERAIESYIYLTNLAKKKMQCKIYLVVVDDGDLFLKEVGKRTGTPVISMETPLVAAAKILANARIYISGRYHPAIMASLGGTPCIFKSSNSHKTASLQELLRYSEVDEFNLLPDEMECNRIINMAIKKMNLPNLRIEIKERAKELNIKAKELANII